MKSRFRFEFSKTKEFSRDEFLDSVKGDKILVLGILGKSKVRDGKANFLDHYTQRETFKIYNDTADDKEDVVEGLHDRTNGCVYLHLRSSMGDASNFVHSIRNNKSGLHDCLTKKRCDGIKLALFLFHVCHLIIVHFPTPAFDLSYINFFQTLDELRQKFQVPISNLVERSDVSREWINNGRFCIPRIIFYFSSAPILLRGSKGTSDLVKRDGKISKHPPIRKLEFSLEDQIYRILKNSQILSYSLFTLPSRDGYVFIDNGTDEVPIKDSNIQNMKLLFSRLESEEIKDEYSGAFLPYFYEECIEESRQKRNFSRFLSAHINAARNRAEGTSTNQPWEIPRSEDWYSVAKSLFVYFHDDSSDSLSHSPILINYAESLIRLSDSKCSKAWPQALAYYKDGLPSHYSQEYHNIKLLQAMSLFSVQARGPCASKYAERLEEECVSYWNADRQNCEVLSLTGRPCTHRKHPTVDDHDGNGERDDKTSTAVPHQSGFIYYSACNCGKKQEYRDDPFELKEANYDFYHRLEQDCCQELEHWDFPVQSTNALGLNESDDLMRLELLTRSVTEMSMEEQTKKTPVPYVLTDVDVKNRILPTFPSWSLLKLGLSNIYSHSAGLNQPGFGTSLKHLLPWEIPLTKNVSESRDKWPDLSENSSKRSSSKSSNAAYTKVFVGCEYECPRGHRFIATSPAKKQVFNPRAVPPRADNIISSDMHLYIPCSCSTQRSLLSQLIRIHIVTPKAAIKVSLLPKVIPTVDGPTFVPGFNEAVHLSKNTYWILRLPFLYAGKDGVHLPSDENGGILKKGFVTVSQGLECD